MNGLARKLTAVIMGFLGSWILTFFTAIGVSPEDATQAVENIDFLIMLLVFGLITFLFEHGLKYLKSVFPGDWADEVWRTHAGKQVEDASAMAAKSQIERGNI